MNTNYLVPRA